MKCPCIIVTILYECSGDHSPVFTGNSPECQKLLREFVLTDVCKEELEWTQTYIKGEYDANDALIDPVTKKLVDEPYKLYDIALADAKKGRDVIPSYSTYLFQAVEAKGAVGNIWQICINSRGNISKECSDKLRHVYRPLYKFVNNVLPSYSES